MLLRRATAGRFKVVNVLPFLVLLGVMVLLAFLNADKDAIPVYTVLTPLLGVKLVATGFVAALCMIPVSYTHLRTAYLPSARRRFQG